MSTALQERPRVASGACERPGTEPAPPHCLSVSLAIRYALVIAIALYLVFCHGCHGEEDNELFALVRAIL